MLKLFRIPKTVILVLDAVIVERHREYQWNNWNFYFWSSCLRSASIQRDAVTCHRRQGEGWEEWQKRRALELGIRLLGGWLHYASSLAGLQEKAFSVLLHCSLGWGLWSLRTARYSPCRRAQVGRKRAGGDRARRITQQSLSPRNWLTICASFGSRGCDLLLIRVSQRFHILLNTIHANVSWCYWFKLVTFERIWQREVEVQSLDLVFALCCILTSCCALCSYWENRQDKVKHKSEKCIIKE